MRFVIDFLGNITETASLTAINLHSGVTLTVNGGNNSLDGAAIYNGFSVAAGSAMTIEDLDLSDIPSTHPALLSGGTLAGTVIIAGSATVDQTATVTFGATGNPALVINQGTYEIDKAERPAIRGRPSMAPRIPCSLTAVPWINWPMPTMPAASANSTWM